MKCRSCWADKAYVRPVKGWKGLLLKCLWMVPLKCHHCYHKFSVPWLLTLGKPLTPPALRVAPGTHGEAGEPVRRKLTDHESIPAVEVRRRVA
jgi:hypothetical protein